VTVAPQTPAPTTRANRRACETCSNPLNSGQLRFCSRTCYGRATSPLTASQKEAVLTLYSKGWPARRIAAAIWQEHGYKSPDACRASISRWLRHRGLNRTRSEAQKLSFAQGRTVTETQKQAIRDARKAYFEKVHAERTHCFNGHPVSEMRVWVNVHGVERRQCRACYRDRYKRYQRGEKLPPRTETPQPKTAARALPKLTPKQPGTGVPAGRIHDAVMRWHHTDESNTWGVLSSRVADILEVADMTPERRILFPLRNGTVGPELSWEIADTIVTALGTGEWYGELADLYEAAISDEPPATLRKPKGFRLTCPKCSARIPDRVGVDRCARCDTSLFPHARKAA
jgi:hypothetical protein